MMPKKGHRNDVMGNVLIYLHDVAGRLHNMEVNEQHLLGVRAEEFKDAIVRLDLYYSRIKRALIIYDSLLWMSFMMALAFVVNAIK